MSGRSLEQLGHLLETGGDADDVLRAVVKLLTDEPGVLWAAIRFLEDGELVLGPSAGEPDEDRRIATPITYRGDPVGELLVDGHAEPELLAGYAQELAPFVLLGWDTFGEAWEP
jgi:hypothetical protein